MSARLVPVTEGTAPTVSLQRPVVLIGRHPECDVRIDLPQVSRRHCCVAQANERITIRDLGSRNGVRVNGRLVEEARLRPGDEVAIAQLIYRLDDPSVPPPAPGPKVETSAPARAASPPPSLPDLPNGDDSDLIPLDDL